MLKNREELRKAREMYSRYLKAEKRRVLVCAGTGCVSGGSMEIFERLSELVSKRGMDCCNNHYDNLLFLQSFHMAQL